MHRYEELEKLYYKKLYLKFFFIFFSIFLVIIGIYYFLNLKKSKSKKEVKKQTEKIIAKSKKEVVVKVIKKEIKPKKEVKKTIESISFVLPEIKDEPIRPKKSKKNTIKNKLVKENSPKKKVEKKVFVIKEQKVNIKTLIKDYQSNPNYHLAILITKLYLKQNDLKNAQKWALKANNLAPDEVESWILFADILKRKNQIKKAIEILKVYEETYGGNDIIEKKLRSLNAK